MKSEKMYVCFALFIALSLVPLNTIYGSGISFLPERNKVVEFSSNGMYLAAASAKDQAIKVWDVQEWQTDKMLPLPNSANYITVSPDNKYIIALAQIFKEPPRGVLKVWEIETGNVTTVDVFSQRACVSSDAHLLAVKEYIYGNIGIFDLRQLNSMKHTEVYDSRQKTFVDIETIGVYDKIRKRFVDLDIERDYLGNCMVFDQEDNSLLLGTTDGQVLMFDRISRQTVKRYRAHSAEVTSVTVSENNQLLAAGASDGSVTILEMENGKLLNTNRIHTKEVSWLQFSNDSQKLYSSSIDGTMCCIEIRNGRSNVLLRAKKGLNSFSLHPNEKLIAAGSIDGTVLIWSLEENAIIKNLK